MIPARTQLRYFARLAYGESLAGEDRTAGDVPVFGSNGSVGFHSVSNTLAPVIVVGRKGSFGKLQYSEEPVFAIDTTFFIDSRFTNCYIKWLFYALQTLRLDDLSEDVGVPGLSRERAYAQRLWLPDLRTQHAIADYLDRETARIDAVIAAKRTMVELLEERRRAVATSLLLGPPVPGRTSGPGQVASRAGWTLEPFRFLFREIDIRSATGQEKLLAVSQTRGVIPQSELGDRGQFAETLVGYKVCQSGDLVVNRMWVYYGALGAANETGLVSPDYSVFRPIAQMSSAFAAYVLRTPAYVGEMTRLVRGIGAAFQGTVRKPRLHPSELGLIQMPVCTQNEQIQLLETLDTQTEGIDQREALLNRSIALLQERRQALITYAVTGRLSVPEAA